MAHFRHEVNTHLDKLETQIRGLRVESSAYQKGLEDMVKMATSIIITTGAVVILGNLSPALITLIREVAQIRPNEFRSVLSVNTQP